MCFVNCKLRSQLLIPKIHTDYEVARSTLLPECIFSSNLIIYLQEKQPRSSSPPSFGSFLGLFDGRLLTTPSPFLISVLVHDFHFASPRRRPSAFQRLQYWYKRQYQRFAWNFACAIIFKNEQKKFNSMRN